MQPANPNPLSTERQPVRSWFDFFVAQIPSLQQHPDKMLLLEWQDFQEFQCSGCGDCCKAPWRILIDQAYCETWEEHFENHPSGRFKQPFTRLENPTAENHANIRRQTDGNRCVFLEDDNLCFIHKHYGPAALPSLCQSFPRAQFAKPRHQYQLRVLTGACPDVPLLWRQALPLQVTVVPAPPTHQGTPELTEKLLLWLGITLDSLLQATPVRGVKELGLSLEQLLAIQPLQHNRLLPAVYREHMRRLSMPPLDFGLHSPEPAQDWAGQLLIEWKLPAMPPSLKGDWLNTDVWQRCCRQYLLQRSSLLPHMVSDWSETYQEYLMQVIYLVMLHVLMANYSQQNPDSTVMQGIQWALHHLDQKIFHHHSGWVRNQGITKLSSQECLEWAQSWLALLD